jgi:Tol biopolymer transport system component/predicted Ser/Thr protein kinase
MLGPGARLGPYEIVSILGAGGMGRIYRARDVRLDRTVAIKLLPEEFSARVDRRQRFQHEARLISALNHPNICSLFDVGEQDGVAFLVMEYVEGETLDDRLTRGPLSATNLLRHAIQIADALDHAHRAQITHRDLKPANIMLTADGAKLLDFGLAHGPPLDVAVPESTMSLPGGKLTGEGTIVGTLHYMAPEQLEGRTTDARTDIFAFGTLLFEMATGKRAFEGKSHASLIASILTSDPPPVSSARPASGVGLLPSALDHIVDRCLAKNPDDRWQSARDLKSELEWVAARGTGAEIKTEAQRGRRARSLVGWAAAAVIALIAAILISVRAPERPGEVVRFTIPLPTGGALARGPITTRLALSPNGRRIAFVTTTAGVDRLWVQSLDSLTPQALADGAESPFWSPDSEWVGFFAPGEGQLKKIALAGGPPRVICAAAIIDVPTWHRNGTILFAQTDVGIFRVPADGGMPTQVTRFVASHREINHLWPVWLPDGRHFIYTATSLDEHGIRAPRTVYIRSIDAGDPLLLMHTESRVTYASPGYLLYAEQGTLLAQVFDADARKVSGDPIKVAENLAYYRSTGNGAFAVSDSGVLAYYGGTLASDLEWLDRSGRKSETGWMHQPFATSIRLSPDGQRVVADLTDPRVGTSDIWSFDLSRRVASRFTAEVTDESSPVWSPDGRRVVFSSDRAGANDLYVKTTDGRDGAELIFSRPGPQVATDWSSDGKWLLVEDNSRDTGRDLWVVSVDGKSQARPIARTRFQEWGGRLSPDDRWMAFVTDESGASEVYVMPFAGVGDKKRISTAGGISPRWRRDGKELFYVSPDSGSVMAVAIAPPPTLTAALPVSLFDLRAPVTARRPREVGFDVTPDGRTFLFSTPPEQPQPGGIAVVLNWQRELTAAH